jgi:hypothetical protein
MWITDEDNPGEVDINLYIEEGAALIAVANRTLLKLPPTTAPLAELAQLRDCIQAGKPFQSMEGAPQLRDLSAGLDQAHAFAQTALEAQTTQDLAKIVGDLGQPPLPEAPPPARKVIITQSNIHKPVV